MKYALVFATLVFLNVHVWADDVEVRQLQANNMLLRRQIERKDAEIEQLKKRVAELEEELEEQKRPKATSSTKVRRTDLPKDSAGTLYPYKVGNIGRIARVTLGHDGRILGPDKAIVRPNVHVGYSPPPYKLRVFSDKPVLVLKGVSTKGWAQPMRPDVSNVSQWWKITGTMQVGSQTLFVLEPVTVVD